MSGTELNPGGSPVPAWHILTEFRLPTDVESGLSLCKQILQDALEMHLSVSQLERLISASQAVVQNSLERSRRLRPDAWVAVRLLLSEKARAQLKSGSIKTQDKQSPTRPPSFGWGFFIVERLTGGAPSDQGSTIVIELFLYLEGEQVVD